MTDPAPKPIADCPNPECRRDCAIEMRFGFPERLEFMPSHVFCAGCGYRGPNVFIEGATREQIDAEAIRLHNLIARPQQSAEPVTPEQFKHLRGDARELAVHRQDCPKVWEFFEKHAGLTVESALPQSCFKCGQVGERAIQHLELPNIYICKSCVVASPGSSVGVKAALEAADKLSFAAQISGGVAGLDDNLVAAIDAYAKAREQQRKHVGREGWVKCSERMPPQGKDVLVYWPVVESDDPEDPIAIIDWIGRANWIPIRERNGGWNWSDSEYSGSQLPSHWMPLPAAPGEK